MFTALVLASPALIALVLIWLDPSEIRVHNHRVARWPLDSRRGRSA